MKHRCNFFVLLSCLFILSACNKDEEKTTVAETNYADAAMWCHRPANCTEDADVFYVVSTMIMQSTNADGSKAFIARLTDEEKDVLAGEINHVNQQIIPSSVNFFAPYYHQMTMESYQYLTYEQLVTNAHAAQKEVCNAFDYYMEHYNNGRPFILAGYSQGSIMVKALLAHMTDSQYNRMVAAYVIGFGLNAIDLSKPHFQAASGADDIGVIISWNSVKVADSLYEAQWSNAVTCMNPVSWKADDTTAVQYVFDGDTLSLHVDNNKHILVVEGLQPDNHPQLPKYPINPWNPDYNYHNWELYLYNPFIKQNILDRIAAYKKTYPDQF